MLWAVINAELIYTQCSEQGGNDLFISFIYNHFFQNFLKGAKNLWADCISKEQVEPSSEVIWVESFSSETPSSSQNVTMHYNYHATVRHVGVDSYDPDEYSTVLSGSLEKCLTWQFHSHTHESTTSCFVRILSHLCLHSELKLVSFGDQRPVPRHSLALRYRED